MRKELEEAANEIHMAAIKICINADLDPLDMIEIFDALGKIGRKPAELAHALHPVHPHPEKESF